MDSRQCDTRLFVLEIVYVINSYLFIALLWLYVIISIFKLIKSFRVTVWENSYPTPLEDWQRSILFGVCLRIGIVGKKKWPIGHESARIRSMPLPCPLPMSENGKRVVCHAVSGGV